MTPMDERQKIFRMISHENHVYVVQFGVLLAVSLTLFVQMAC
jgi:hypothetical protein